MHVALKILRSDCYDGSHDIFELEMLQHIAQKSHISHNPGRNHVIQLLDHFRHEVKGGTHVCLVFPVLGHHLGLQAAKFEQGRIPVAVMKKVARQLLQGLDYLHRECGIIHTGRAPDTFDIKRNLSHVRKLMIDNEAQI
jgi:serine/threonine-protein kinase SRPK3